MKIQIPDQITEAPMEHPKSLPSEQGGTALAKPLGRTRQKIAATIHEQPLSPEQVAIWEKATAFCVRKLPTLWTAGEPRRDLNVHSRWIMPIVLRYEAWEAILGEMYFDEQSQEFTLPERAVLSERAREVASERERLVG